MVVGILDYEGGNLSSMGSAVRYCGYNSRLITEASELQDCDKIIIPGVGQAQATMNALEKRDLINALKCFFEEKRPILGVCIGAQIPLEFSEEGHTPCLSLIKGRVKRLPALQKIPHMGWNTVRIVKKTFLFEGVADDSPFYFVHSYYPQISSDLCLAECNYSLIFPAAYYFKNYYATQFHVEKSGEAGLRILHNFLSWKS